MRAYGIDLTRFDEDGMTGVEKLELISNVSQFKAEITQVVEIVEELQPLLADGSYAKYPIIALCVEQARALIEEHGEAIRAMREKADDIYSRLYESAGSTAVVRGIQAEFEALQPEIAQLNASFQKLRDAVAAKRLRLCRAIDLHPETRSYAR